MITEREPRDPREPPDQLPQQGAAGADTSRLQAAQAAFNPASDPGTFNYQAPAYTGPSAPQFHFPGVPQFHAPEFQVPGAEGMYADPGYQARLSEGEKALQSSAAAQGVLRSGGTLQDILKYGQNFASQEYANVYDRALKAFDTKYKGALDAYSPLLRSYELNFGAQQQAGLAAYQRAWDEYQFRLNDEFRREQMVFNAGANAAGQ